MSAPFRLVLLSTLIFILCCLPQSSHASSTPNITSLCVNKTAFPQDVIRELSAFYDETEEQPPTFYFEIDTGFSSDNHNGNISRWALSKRKEDLMFSYTFLELYSLHTIVLGWHSRELKIDNFCSQDTLHTKQKTIADLLLNATHQDVLTPQSAADTQDWYLCHGVYANSSTSTLHCCVRDPSTRELNCQEVVSSATISLFWMTITFISCVVGIVFFVVIALEVDKRAGGDNLNSGVLKDSFVPYAELILRRHQKSMIQSDSFYLLRMKVFTIVLQIILLVHQSQLLFEWIPLPHSENSFGMGNMFISVEIDENANDGLSIFLNLLKVILFLFSLLSSIGFSHIFMRTSYALYQKARQKAYEDLFGQTSILRKWPLLPYMFFPFRLIQIIYTFGGKMQLRQFNDQFERSFANMNIEDLLRKKSVLYANRNKSIDPSNPPVDDQQDTRPPDIESPKRGSVMLGAEHYSSSLEAFAKNDQEGGWVWKASVKIFKVYSFFWLMDLSIMIYLTMMKLVTAIVFILIGITVNVTQLSTIMALFLAVLLNLNMMINAVANPILKAKILLIKEYESKAKQHKKDQEAAQIVDDLAQDSEDFSEDIDDSADFETTPKSPPTNPKKNKDEPVSWMLDERNKSSSSVTSSTTSSSGLKKRKRKRQFDFNQLVMERAMSFDTMRSRMDLTWKEFFLLLDYLQIDPRYTLFMYLVVILPMVLMIALLVYFSVEMFRGGNVWSVISQSVLLVAGGILPKLMGSKSKESSALEDVRTQNAIRQWLEEEHFNARVRILSSEVAADHQSQDSLRGLSLLSKNGPKHEKIATLDQEPNASSPLLDGKKEKTHGTV